MSDPNEPKKAQDEFFENLKKMMSQVNFRPEAAQTERVEDDESKSAAKRKAKLQFNFKPKEVKKHLDRFVVKQDEAKRVLATAVCDHYHHVQASQEGRGLKDYVKQNILILGPTGVGKTYLIRHLAELIGVPFVKADATKFSETGYVGADVEDLVRELVHKADGDISLAECGMIYVDEIDKIATVSGIQGRDVSGSGVQRGLLKIMEETDVPARNPQDLQSQLQGMVEFQRKGKMTRPMINTKNILFIVSGAFTDLGRLVQLRQKEDHIGFSTISAGVKKTEDLLRETRTEDFVKFGFEAEFIGRLSVRVVCDALNSEDLFKILKDSEGSIIKQYQAAFNAYGISMKVRDDALWEVAKRAESERTGARGLATILEKIFRDPKYELPSSHLKEFTFTKQLVLEPGKTLAEILSEEIVQKVKMIESEIKHYEQDYFLKHGVKIRFDEMAIQAINEKLSAEDEDLKAYLDKLLANYDYGLGLIQKHSPRNEFVLGADVIREPNVVLEKWIKKSYASGDA